jgi:5-methyltetrahydrofolate--homocysteine methyltransferase
MEPEVQELLRRIALCIELGKDSAATSYPPEMAGEDGVDELVRRALGSGVDPNDVLAEGLMPGMDRIGALFGERKVFVPQLLLSARAMTKGLEHLKPYFRSGEAVRKGKLVLGVVAGDLHDIGKNLVRMMVEGAGWEVIDLGIDQPIGSFVEAVKRNPGCSVGVGTLLTSTMRELERTVEKVKLFSPETVVVVGGAPVSEDYADSIGADRFLRNAHAAREYFATL